MDTPEPFTLAAADDEFVIDPALANLDIPTHSEEDDDNDLFLPEGTQDEDATVLAIKHSLSRSEAHAAATNQIHSRPPPFPPSQAEQHPSPTSQAGPSNSADQSGSTEDDPTHNPVTHVAPYSAPNRDVLNAPLPLFLAFDNRAEFEVWLAGENSWCHFVQRRTTTPEKRAEERMKARDKAHEQLLASLTAEEAATVPDLKKRRRQRTSQITEKISFTCHHAGTYQSRHIEPVASKKLRLNTKKTVKCGCPSRMVLSELADGSCKVMYHWRHEGHDPYTGAEMMNSRLPKILDDWVTTQIESGKGTEAILKLAEITEEGRAEFLLKAETDPSYDPNDLPPLIATKAKIKYPDVYNRLRKLKGPIRAGKPKAPKPTKLGMGTRPRKRKAIAISGTGDEDMLAGGVDVDVGVGESMGATPAGVDGQFGEEYSGEEGGLIMGDGLIVDDVRMGQELARLAGEGGLNTDGQDDSHEDLARAILRMSPVVLGEGVGVGYEEGTHLGLEMDEVDVGKDLDEAVRRLAEAGEGGGMVGGLWEGGGTGGMGH